MRAEVLLHLRLGKEDKKMAFPAGLQVATSMRAGHYQCNYSISTFCSGQGMSWVCAFSVVASIKGRLGLTGKKDQPWELEQF